ncbi:hypothetical protein WCE37_05515 [Luteimonas sp. MJ250]|uniref:hypothetical protein n=1 Tax=Luteimonas sp. MJ250 TaxID=3129236 RepID=UPI0031BB3A2D
MLADLFSIAVVEGRNSHLAALAAEVVKLEDKMPRALQDLAMRVSGLEAKRNEVELVDAGDVQVINPYISNLKSRLSSSPSNGFLWNDLSYAYNLIGEKEKSERAMLAALKVSGSHRLIARGASRLFMHHHDPERALSVLKRAQSFSVDPWLLSAHIAVSQASGQESVFIAAARRALQRLGTGHLHSSELGMALATQELRGGKMKRAKIIARESGVDATENALAQAVWLSPRLRTDVVTKEAIAATAGAFEAKCWGAFYEGDWGAAVENAVLWLNEEPYSVVPALQGSFVAATFMHDYVRSLKIAEFGLGRNPDSDSLRNNYVVALAMSGDLARAEGEFIKMSGSKADPREHAVWMATSGLLKYRRNEVEHGRALYDAARIEFEKVNDRTAQLTLTLYQSMEEARAGNVERSKEMISSLYRKLGLRDEKVAINDALEREVLRRRSTD